MLGEAVDVGRVQDRTQRAMPDALPSSREASFTKEPTPCFNDGGEELTAVVDGVSVTPMPTERSSGPPGAGWTEGVSAFSMLWPDSDIPLTRPK